MGNGIYSDKLPYEHWYKFNLAIRVHHNFVEQLPFLVGILLVGGIYWTNCAIALGVLNCFTRPMYIYQYLSQGSEGRKLGQIIGTGGMYVLAGLTIYSLVAN